MLEAKAKFFQELGISLQATPGGEITKYKVRTVSNRRRMISLRQQMVKGKM